MASKDLEKMTPSEGFAALPREIRDMIFVQIASAAGLSVTLQDSYILETTNDRAFSNCIITLCEWAPRSSVAKAACEAMVATARLWCGSFSVARRIVYPKNAVFEKDLGFKVGVDLPLGSFIDVRSNVRRIMLSTSVFECRGSHPDNKKEQEDLSTLIHNLTQLSQCPRLRHLEFKIFMKMCTSDNPDAWDEAIPFVARLSSAIKELRKQMGEKYLSIILEEQIVQLSEGKLIFPSHDITWMWDPPTSPITERETTTNSSLGAAKERIRALIAAEGVDQSEKKSTLQEELRAIAEQLRQHNADK